ncbi:MAG: hypothetical protein ACI8XX_002631 [Polaribacter sp.]|jgi:hypothetical protein
MKNKTLDKKFDDGDNILDAFDLSKARRPNQEQKRVNVDFPTWMVSSLDKEARHLGVTRQSIIKVWLAERLEKSASNRDRELLK